MRIFLISIVLFSVSFVLQAQDQWEYSDYEKVSVSDFRYDKRVNQVIDCKNPDIPLMNALLFYLTNEKRIVKGKEQIEYHPLCEIAAYNHSKEMVEQGFFSHTNNKDEKRKSTSDRAKLAGISSPSIAENISFIYFSEGMTYMQIAEKTFDSWMKSTGHRENILSENALQMGGGVFLDGKKVYSTQVFQWFSKIVEQDAIDKLPKLKNGKKPKLPIREIED